jgi:hypothetical protein
MSNAPLLKVTDLKVHDPIRSVAEAQRAACWHAHHIAGLDAR